MQEFEKEKKGLERNRKLRNSKREGLENL